MLNDDCDAIGMHSALSKIENMHCDAEFQMKYFIQMTHSRPNF